MTGEFRRGTYAALLGLLAVRCASALNPSLDVSQYGHFAWKIRDGFFESMIHAFAQTQDGYLWLGTDSGLLRFDGVRPARFEPPQNQYLPSDSIAALLAGRDGTLWIGTLKGLASLKDGKLTHYPELDGQYVDALLEDREGTVWAAGRALPLGKLCAIQKNGTRCGGEDGSLGNGVFNLYEDHKGNLWASAANGLWRWKPGLPRLYLPPKELEPRPFAEENDGALLIGTRGGIKRLIDGKIEPYPLPGWEHDFLAHNVLRDRDGGMWIASQGLVHVQQGRTDLFAQSDGLSGDDCYALFEDREGSIWVSTPGGLDRFRDLAVATFSASQGVSNTGAGPVLAARGGSLWGGFPGGLTRLQHGEVAVYHEHKGKVGRGVREIIGSGLPEHGFASLFQDSRGRIWVATLNGLGYLENDRFITMRGVPRGPVYSIVEDGGGDLWFAHQDRGLLHLLRDGAVQPTPWERLGHKSWAGALAAHPAQRGLWIGFASGDVILFADGEVRKTYTTADGLGAGRVNELRLDPDGTLWAATEGGLSRLRNGRIATLSKKSGLPCDAVHWVLEDDDRAFWLKTPCGLVRIARPDMVAWIADPAHSIKPTLFDNSDGVMSTGMASGLSPRAGKSPDGRLWFTSLDGISVVDPRRLAVNKLPPPVSIEQIKVDGKVYEGRRLPPMTRDVWIDYTALSLVAPEKVRFRYKLEGQDPDWKEVVNDREARYSNLAPRSYRFRLQACNNSGVWNEAGATLDFSIEPKLYQMRWFQATCVAGALALLAGFYQARLQFLKHQFNIRLEERVNERTRIARDLHDTLLQSFQGVLTEVHAVSYLLADRPEICKSLDDGLRSGQAGDHRGPGCRAGIALLHADFERPCPRHRRDGRNAHRRSRFEPGRPESPGVRRARGREIQRPRHRWSGTKSTISLVRRCGMPSGTHTLTASTWKSATTSGSFV